MTALGMIEELAIRGVTLSRSAGKIRAEGLPELLTDGLRVRLLERKPELLAVLAGDWFGAAGAVLLHHVGRICDDDWWSLDEQFARRVRDLTQAGVGQVEAERMAYCELAGALEDPLGPPLPTVSWYWC